MIRTTLLALMISLALSPVASANGSPKGHENGNGHHKEKPSSNGSNSYSASASKAEADATAIAKGGNAEQAQGQLQGQVAVGSVSVDDSSSYRIPVYASHAPAQSTCGRGGAGANWKEFALNLGQSPDPICMRLLFKESLQMENSMLSDVSRLIGRIPAQTDPKGPTTDKVVASLATSVAAAILKNNARIEEQNQAIEEELDGGFLEKAFGWMRRVPVLKVLY